MPHFAASKPRAILSLCTGDQYLHFSATPCGVFIIFSSCFVFFFLPYFVGFQLFGLIVAQEGQNIKTKEQNQTTKIPTKPIKQLSKNSGCWLSGYLPSEKMAEVRKNKKWPLIYPDLSRPFL